MRILAVVGSLAILAAVALAVYFLGGYYNVSAQAEDPGLVNWALVQVRSRAIARMAPDPPPANLRDTARIQAGARAFSSRGCVNCHGGPGVEWAKFSEGLHPDPPDLKEVANERTPQQLFWVIKNGINMTGMPSFAAIEMPD